MATSATIPMIGPNGEIGQVTSDRADAAQAAGFKPAVKMQGPDGNQSYVAQDRVDAARQSNYAVTPDNPGVQRMATPQGKLTYALPGEADAFKASGHVPIADSGNFRVDPLEGEAPTDTMARAAAIAKNLPPDVMKKAIESEGKTMTAKRIATNLVAAPIIGAVGAAGLVGGSEALGAGSAALGETELGQLISSSPRLYAEYLLKHSVAPVAGEVLKGAAKVAIGTGLSYMGLSWLKKVL